MPVLRSLLFVPGNRANMLQKATGSNPDAFVPDLEDSVPADEKTEARNVTAAHLATLAQAGARVIPRVNSLDTGLLEEDLAAVVGAHVYGVSVGKISTPADVAAVDGLLETLEARPGCSAATSGWCRGSRRRWPSSRPTTSARRRRASSAWRSAPRT